MFNFLNNLFNNNANGASQGGNVPQQTPPQNGGNVGQELDGILTFAERFAKFKTEKPFLYKSVRWFVIFAFIFFFSGNIKEVAEAVVILGEFFQPIFADVFAFYGKVLESFGLITLKAKTIATVLGFVGCIVANDIRQFIRNRFKK